MRMFFFAFSGLCVSRKKFFLVFYSASFFMWSYFLLMHYTNGDQGSYRLFYQALQSVPVGEVMPIALAYVSSEEPLSAFILWVGANLGLDKDVYVSILNLVLFVGGTLLLQKKIVHGMFLCWS
ncbi:hypothetical protein [Chlorobium phaeovibrioides]|uniref:hypothetical protein n=1 Tax=Chlorobium phaeovibrioides TaxID=1094 RepID=UPI001230FA17|nr:hypothetical protein [Chlorobium phaeovibrioides]QEQ57217.1 hypothetical protein FNV82_06265 [Chlorobium phaeovibrioides]